MFQLFELILASPIGAAIYGALQNSIYAAVVLSDCDDCGFNDLGRLLFGGLILAVVVGIAISIVRHRMKETGADSSEFVSIRVSDPRR